MRKIVWKNGVPMSGAADFLMERFGKMLGAMVPDVFMSAFFERMRDKSVPFRDVKILKGGKLAADGEYMMTFDEALEYLAEWRMKRGSETMRERMCIMFAPFLASGASSIIRDIADNGAGAWKRFRKCVLGKSAFLVGVPDPEFAANPENPLPLLRDCLPVDDEKMRAFGPRSLMNFYNSVLMSCKSVDPGKALAAGLEIAELASSDPENFVPRASEKNGWLGKDLAESLVPFVATWKNSPEFPEMMAEITDFMHALTERRKAAIAMEGGCSPNALRDGIMKEVCDEAGEDDASRQLPLM